MPPHPSPPIPHPMPVSHVLAFWVAAQQTLVARLSHTTPIG